jgi:hypothetical protein
MPYGRDSDFDGEASLAELGKLAYSYVEDNDIGHSDSSFENVDSIIS